VVYGGQTDRMVYGGHTDEQMFAAATSRKKKEFTLAIFMSKKKINTAPAYTNRYIVAMLMNKHICRDHIREQIVCHGHSHEQTGEWRKLHNEELCDLYSSPHLPSKTRD
jgi:hypothetical protein